MDSLSGFFAVFGSIGTGTVIAVCWVLVMAVILVNWRLAHTRRAGEPVRLTTLFRLLRNRNRTGTDRDTPLRRPRR